MEGRGADHFCYTDCILNSYLLSYGRTRSRSFLLHRLHFEFLSVVVWKDEEPIILRNDLAVLAAGFLKQRLRYHQIERDSQHDQRSARIKGDEAHHDQRKLVVRPSSSPPPAPGRFDGDGEEEGREW